MDRDHQRGAERNVSMAYLAEYGRTDGEDTAEGGIVLQSQVMHDLVQQLVGVADYVRYFSLHRMIL
jgi:hypothetical protein